MAKMTYAEQLKHPNWQKKRLEMLNRAEWKCMACHDSESTLHVHHKHYVKDRMAWEYSDGELAVLCENCHEWAHEQEPLFKTMLALLPIDGPGSKHNAMAIVAGWSGKYLPDEISEAFYQLEPFNCLVGRIAMHLYCQTFNINKLMQIEQFLSDEKNVRLLEELAASKTEQ